MAQLCQEMSADARTIELIKLIAEKHNVVVEINPYEHWVDFKCGPKKQMAIAEDIEKYFDTF